MGRGPRTAEDAKPLAVGRRRRPARSRSRPGRGSTAARPAGLGRSLARAPAAGRTPSGRAGRTAGRAGKGRDARAGVVYAASRRAARRAHRHGDGPRPRLPRRRLVRDHPRRPAPLLAPAEGARALRVKIVERTYSEADRRALLKAGVHPLLARIFAARRIASADELRYEAASLLHPKLLKNAERAAQLLADAIAQQERLLIVADYDADGATACAVGVRALRRFGGNVEYLVPDRFKLGYGLSPELVDIASHRKPDVLITVDNGIASVEGVAHAKRLGIATLITDHHLPGAELPDAACIVNPNQADCAFPSKALAGVGVMFYVMLALRTELRTRGALREEPNLGSLTDLVALGTIADVVPLDANNRNLVAQGLKRLRAGHGKPGIVQLLRAAGRAPSEASSFDLGFVAGPRLNAAGRLADMSLGIECLLTDDEARAANCAQELDRLNRERRKIEAAMLEQAAGLTIAEADYERFCAVFERTLEQLLPAEARLHTVETDGALEAAHCTLEVARLIEAQIWGQGFPQPLFCDTFAVESQRVVGERHLKLRLIKDGRRFEAMRFGALDPVADRVRAAYRLSVNEFNGLKNVQLNVEHIE